MSYLRFGAMIVTATVVMFGLMYLSTYVFEHIFYSETRTYMAIVMGAVMAVIMLGFMWGMYENTTLNWTILAVSVVVFGLALWLVRSQMTVGDVSFMRAMIPHHSIAIMTSKRADISDPRVRKLADEIVAAQEKEIAEMRYLIHDIIDNGDADEDVQLGEAPVNVVSLSEALSTADIAVLDPEAMKPADIVDVMGGTPPCQFRRTVDSDPILLASHEHARGMMKLSGDLIELNWLGANDSADGIVLQTEGARLVVTPGEDGESADLTFQLDRGLRVGYAGYWSCSQTTETAARDF